MLRHLRDIRSDQPVRVFPSEGVEDMIAGSDEVRATGLLWSCFEEAVAWASRHIEMGFTAVLVGSDIRMQQLMPPNDSSFGIRRKNTLHGIAVEYLFVDVPFDVVHLQSNGLVIKDAYEKWRNTHLSFVQSRKHIVSGQESIRSPDQILREAQEWIEKLVGQSVEDCVVSD